MVMLTGALLSPLELVEPYVNNRQQQHGLGRPVALVAMQGVTQVSQMVQYPADPSIDTPPVWVAHFAHPIEVEWVARAAPAPKDWPRLLLQVGQAHNMSCSLFT